MGRILRGDLGRSIRNQEPVIENVGRRIRPSLQLAGLAMAISLVVAIAGRHPLGRAPQYRRSTASAPRSRCSASACRISCIALLLIFVFGVTLRWLPISGYVDPWEEPMAGLRSLVLPAVTLGLALAAVVTRTLRSSMLEALVRGLRPHRAGQGTWMKGRSCAATC